MKNKVAKAKKQMTAKQMTKFVETTLEDIKAIDVRVLDVRKLTSITDFMVVASGTSRRHVRGIAERLVEEAKKEGFPAMGVEGEQESEWVLVDLVDVVVHIMQAETRQLYDLEGLWSVGA